MNNFENFIHPNAQAEEYVRRGFAHARVDEWADAKEQFQKAAEICPDCGMYRFYIMYAETDGFTVPFRLYVDTGWNYDVTMEINREYKAVFKALNDEEKAFIQEEFKIDFTNETTLKAGLVPYFLSDISESNEAGFDLNIQFLTRIVIELSKQKKLATVAAEIVFDWCVENGYERTYKDLYDWSLAFLPESKRPKEPTENPIEKGVYKVLKAELLPVDKDGVLKLEDRRIQSVWFESTEVAKAASARVKKFILTKNIKKINAGHFEVPLVVVEEDCDIDKACEIAVWIATVAIQVPKGCRVKAHSFKNAFFYAEGAFHNDSFYEYNSGQICYNAAIMGKAMFLPLKKSSYEKKFVLHDYDASKFKEKATAFIGFPAIKKRKFIKLVHEKQYDKARKMNKEK